MVHGRNGKPFLQEKFATANPWMAKRAIGSVQLCDRIFALETEEKRLRLTIAHLDDSQTFELTYDQLASYGFQA